MEYVYAVMLLHSAKKEVDEKNLSSVLKAAGVEAEQTKLKALVASLKEINIDEAIKSAAFAPAAQAPAAAEKKEEKKDDRKSEEEAAAGLGSLFG